MSLTNLFSNKNSHFVGGVANGFTRALVLAVSMVAVTGCTTMSVNGLDELDDAQKKKLLDKTGCVQEDAVIDRYNTPTLGGVWLSSLLSCANTVGVVIPPALSAPFCVTVASWSAVLVDRELDDRSCIAEIVDNKIYNYKASDVERPSHYYY